MWHMNPYSSGLLTIAPVSVMQSWRIWVIQPLPNYSKTQWSWIISMILGMHTHYTFCEVFAALAMLISTNKMSKIECQNVIPRVLWCHTTDNFYVQRANNMDRDIMGFPRHANFINHPNNHGDNISGGLLWIACNPKWPTALPLEDKGLTPVALCCNILMEGNDHIQWIWQIYVW